MGREHLKPAKKGEVRNPTGKRGPLKPATAMRRVLRELMEAPADKRELTNFPPHIPIMFEQSFGRVPTRQDLMALAVMTKAMEGDVQAFNALLDRTEGKPIQKTQNQNLNMNYVDFLKAKQAELENNEEEKQETEVFSGQSSQPEASEDN